MSAMDDLERRYARWRATESDGQDDPPGDAAESAFEALFTAVMPEVRVPATFSASTLQAIAEVAERDATRARRMRWALGSASVAVAGLALYFGTGPALSLLSSLFVHTIDAVVAAVVWLASSAETGPDLWSVVAGLGRAAGAFISDPKVTVVLLALHGVAIAAFIGLQRLLGSDPEYLP
jgi:hypothetical protein